jgi:hypothetical protein
MDAAQLQHKLFPLSPVTLEEFKSNARVTASCNAEENQKLFWQVMAEDLSEEQVIYQPRHRYALYLQFNSVARVLS